MLSRISRVGLCALAPEVLGCIRRVRAHLLLYGFGDSAWTISALLRDQFCQSCIDLVSQLFGFPPNGRERVSGTISNVNFEPVLFWHFWPNGWLSVGISPKSRGQASLLGVG